MHRTQIFEKNTRFLKKVYAGKKYKAMLATTIIAAVAV